jgi:hypothetical protein
MLLRTRLLTTAGVIVAASSTAAVASAAQRYASPAGSGTACIAANPCTIRQAIEGASKNDEVIVTPGDYPLTATLATPIALNIHGVAGQPRPRLLFSGPSLDDHGFSLQWGSTLKDVEVDQDAGNSWPAITTVGSSVDQVIARGSGQGGWTVVNSSSTIRNSIIVASGVNAVALETHANGFDTTGTFRNVTAIATGSLGTAIRAWGVAGSVNVLARNVIARGGPGGYSLVADASNPGTSATITVGHSDWQTAHPNGAGASIADGGGNEASAPVFVNEAAGDYHEAAGSPTIDAGMADFLSGDVDVDGDPRTIGSTDIGADEFVLAPSATTGPVSGVTTHSAVLHGTVNANGVPTIYRFEYGRTTAYGSTTAAADAGSGTSPTAATTTLTGLSPATTYHYRLVADNSGVGAKGTDMTFTTAAAPPPAFGGVHLVSTRLPFGPKFVTLRLSCPAATVGRCSGTTKLTVRRRTASGAIVTVTLGRATFSIAPSQRATMQVRLTRAGRRILRHVRRLKGHALNAAHDGAGQFKTTIAAVTIRRRPR